MPSDNKARPGDNRRGRPSTCSTKLKIEGQKLERCWQDQRVWNKVPDVSHSLQHLGDTCWASLAIG